LLPVSIDVPIVQQLPNVEYAALARPGAERGLAARASRLAEARGLRRIERALALRARLTITASPTDREHLLAIAPAAAVEVVENSVDLARLPQLPATEPAAAPLLLFVGSFDYPPNAEALRELIAHLPALRAARPGVRVRCIGGGLHGPLAAAARSAAIETPGHVPDLLPHYREATAVYLPIRSGGGTRIKVLEALAVGRPVLSTHIGVEGLGLQEGRDYLSCETPRAGARGLEQLANGAAADLVSRGRALVETRYCHAVVRRRIDELFDELFPVAD
jgi:glycosyltransferase involved in cell wall biosynthesis